MLTPAYSLAHSLSLLCGLEAVEDFSHWCQLNGLWTFIVLHGTFELGFMLRHFELARFVQLRPYYAITLSGLVEFFFLYS